MFLDTYITQHSVTKIACLLLNTAITSLLILLTSTIFSNESIDILMRHFSIFLLHHID